MRLHCLNIINYKNIEEASLEFSDKINCLIGNNGMGKTNVLDVIYYLSFCKSHTNVVDSQNIKHDSDFFMIKGNYQKNGDEEEIYCGVKRRQKKQFKRGQKEYEKLSDHIGLIPLVMVSPDDSQLISEGSYERRKFMDGVISQYNKTYLQQLLQYNNLLKQRNALLKSERPVDVTIFEVLEEQMNTLGQYIFQERTKFITEFIPVFQNFHITISGDNEQTNLEYTSQYQRHGNLLKRMSETRERDLILGFSTQGIHKDDLEMTLGDHPIKKVGSQGQNKTYLIALKFAQFDFLKKIHNCSPILLLDDIFDKLDAIRVEAIIKLVTSDLFGQIFITDTNRENLDALLTQLNSNAKIFNVINGKITSQTLIK
ncbi:MAG TPA: DNA replication and repair protein RecF [Paludibacter sp.]|jgi:DNA replication and repair protein RecF|nr:MAG: DNA replication and repair protein RecF [Bacteroidetes bacterium ADurb.Bin174]HQB28181.1 DNA replication and repair protein RecF [Paludibacter sp.]